MILTDAGPLIAILDRDDRDHKVCVAVLSRVRGPMVTTCAAFTEAIYLLGERGGWKAQEALLNVTERGDLRVAELQDDDWARVRSLMKKYADLPMDFADATLVVLAERLNTRRVFTLDADFRAYRLGGKHAFTVMPKL